jgi:hypothetical protein
LLQNLHGWVAKQQVQVDIKSQISIVAALQEAESRVLAGRIYEATPDQLTHEPAQTLTLKDERATADL